MINIDVVSESNLWSIKKLKNQIFFNSLVQVFPKKYRFIKKKVSLTILLSNNKNIKKLNKKFRNKNKATDVLSFPSEKKLNIKKSLILETLLLVMNLWINQKFQIFLEFKNKVTKIFIHGFLHLLGYDHIKLKDFKKMLTEEEKIYKTIETKIVKLV